MIPIERLKFPSSAAINGAEFVDGEWKIVNEAEFMAWWYSGASMVYMFKVLINGTEAEHHYFRLTRPGESYWSQTIRSMTYFIQREYNRCDAVNERVYGTGDNSDSWGYKGPMKFPNPYVIKQTSFDRETDRHMQLRQEARGIKEPEFPSFYHGSLYDCYAAIGYDYKNQRYDEERYGRQPKCARKKKHASN